MGDTVKTHIDLQRMQQEVWKLNNTFKYAKFVLDNNYRVHIEYDLLHATDNKGACALEMIVCSDKIIDEAVEMLTCALLDTNSESLNDS